MTKAKTDKSLKTKRGAKRTYLPEIKDILSQVDFELLKKDLSSEPDAGKRQLLESRQNEHRQQLQEVEHRLVYGDDLAKYIDQLVLIGQELISREDCREELTQVAKGELSRRECQRRAFPSEFIPEEFLKPIQKALIDKDADFFRAIAELIEWHERGKPASSTDLAFLILKQRDGLESGTIKQLRNALDGLREEGIIDFTPTHEGTIKQAALRCKIGITNGQKGRPRKNAQNAIT